ncbi:MAG: CHAT domain-containing protein [Emticicia sp.]|uniref:CHAT domain-containing protein n=1 Tax=Emticicia sp. TaxID=1930953 RepID=UPI003BA6BC96
MLKASKYTFWLFLLLIRYQVQGQCLDNKPLAGYFSQLQKSITEKDSVMLLSYKKQFEKCHLQTDTSYTKILYFLGILFQDRHEYDKAINYFLRAKSVNAKINSSPLTQIKVLSQLSYSYYKSFNYVDALDTYQQIVLLGQSQKELAVYVTNAYEKQANIYNRLGDFESSIKKALLGQKISKMFDDPEMEAYNLIILSKSQNSIGATKAALESIDKAISIFEGKKLEEDLAAALSAKGYIESKNNEKDKALKSFKRVASIFKKLKDDRGYSLACLDIGYVYYKHTDQLEKALSYYNEGVKFATSPFTKVQLFDNIGAVYWKKKDYKKALEYYQKCLIDNGFFRFSDDNITRLPKSISLKYTDNKRTFLTILQDKAICWLDYAKSENNKKEFLSYALQTYKLADKIIDYMRQEHTGTQTKFYWRDKTRSIYESAIETCYLLNDYEKAFYFFEKSRSVLLNDKLNELGAKQKLSEVDFQKEKDFLHQISEINISIEKASTEKQRNDFNNQLLDIEEQQSRFIKSLEAKNPAYYQIKYDTTTISLRQFQKYLSSFKGQAVEYFIGDAATYAIVVSPNSVSIKQLYYNIANTQQFLELCSKNINTKTDLNKYLSLGSAMYRSLIQPLNLQKGRLIISQDGAFIPFEALSKSATKYEYLVHDFKISYIYSAQYLMRNQQNFTFLPQNKFLGIAPVSYNLPKLNLLKGSAESLEAIAKSYFWSSKYIGKEGSKNAFLVNAKKHQIVQIYTHAFADSNDTEPRIYFSDTTLKVSELNSEEQFKTNLLVLSACKTGVGKVAKGEGVLSLARGFSMLGIPSTITSLWSVEDKSTYKLTELFYQYLNQGLPKDEALQKAKIDLLNEGSLPNAWAGMILIGDASNISSDYSHVWLLTGLVLITIVGIWFWRKSKK